MEGHTNPVIEITVFNVAERNTVDGGTHLCTVEMRQQKRATPGGDRLLTGGATGHAQGTGGAPRAQEILNYPAATVPRATIMGGFH